jgi:hypothetical protein
MGIIYNESPEPYTGKGGFKLENARATEKWLEHFSNSLILTAIMQSPKDRVEKQAASRELAICDRKMAFWKRHPNFNLHAATFEATELKKLWAKKK